MTVPFPYPEDINGTMGLIEHANIITNGYLGISILILIGVVSFISSKNFSSEKAFGFSAFLILISSILLRLMNLINNTVLYICIVAFVAVAIWMWTARENESV